jgi:hypothetical protein
VEKIDAIDFLYGEKLFAILGGDNVVTKVVLCRVLQCACPSVVGAVVCVCVPLAR